MLDVRELGAAHRASAVGLWRVAGLTRPWNDPVADFDRARSGPSSTVLGAFDGATLVGTAMVGHDGHRGWVYYLAVQPAVRGRGVGRLLVQAAERWVADRGVPKLNLMVRRDNSEALAFYAALGYGDDDVVVLAKRLGA